MEGFCMAQPLVEQARSEEERAKEKVVRLREELLLAEQEANGWEDFIARACLLAGKANGAPSKNGETNKHVEVQRDTIPGLVATIIRKHAQAVTLTTVVNELIALGKGDDGRKFRNAVNSAIWRRHDLFKKTDDGYVLVDKDFVLVERETRDRT
jgi:hypothetical protein